MPMTAPLAMPHAAPPAPIAVAAPPRPVADFDRAWFDSRLADVTQRVEAKLVAMMPQDALSTIGTRLDQIETKFGNTLANVALRSDLPKVDELAAQVRELGIQFERVREQFGRIDSLERHIRSIGERIDSEIARASVESMPEPVAIDIEHVAQSTAERVAQRFVTAMPPPAATALPDLTAMLEAYIAERRRGDGQTAEALETVQEALVQLLDRVDRPAPVQPAMPPADAFVPPPPPHIDDRHALAPELPEQPAPRDASLRRDFAAAAERAKQMARAKAVEAPTRVELPPMPDVEPDAPVAAPVTRDRRPGPSHATGEQVGEPAAKSRMNPALLVATVVALLIGTGYLVTELMGFGAPEGQKFERKLAAPAPGALLTPPAAKLPAKAPAAQPAAAPAVAAQPAPNTAPAMRPATTELPRNTEAAPPAIDKDAPLLPPDPVRRSQPETAVEDLSQNGAPTAPAAPSPTLARQNGVTSGPLPGITVFEGRPASPEAIARVQHQQQLATASTRLGHTGARPVTAAGVTALPGVGAEAGRADRAQPAAPEAPTDVSSIASAMAPDMPPALIGPTSLRIAAQKGDPSAEFEVAARFAEGKGVKQDFKQAYHWYNRSASRGFAPAQYRLGTLYERGIATKADLGKARAWYKRAADQGNVKAMHNLAVLSAGREQGSPDYVTAAQWFTQAAERGLPDSQFNLGVLAENGLGVAKDLRHSYQWFTLAARGGDKEAARRRDQLITKMDPADVQAGDALVAAFRAKAADPRVNDARVAGDAWRVRADQGQPLPASAAITPAVAPVRPAMPTLITAPVPVTAN
jgi:localization factor PodJL